MYTILDLLDDRERMDLRCKQEALREDGSKIMEFTEGDVYTFVRRIDPEGWEVLDDNLDKEVFFNPFIMFEKVK